MAEPNTKTTVAWQVVGLGLRKWVQRPLHNGKKNFWWSVGDLWWGDCEGHEIEVRRLIIDAELGFFASEQEALGRLERLLLDEVERLKNKSWESFSYRELILYGKQPTASMRWSYDHRADSHVKAIARIKERQAWLAGVATADQEPIVGTVYRGSPVPPRIIP
jgi:hypothetical protein